MFTLLVVIYIKILLRLRVESIKKNGVVQSDYCNLQYGAAVPVSRDTTISRTFLLFLTLFVVTGAASEL